VQENAKADLLPTPDELAGIVYANRQDRSVGCVFVKFAMSHDPGYTPILAGILLTDEVAARVGVEVINRLGISRQRSVIATHRNGSCVSCTEYFAPHLGGP
jgi:hypothetical protein